MTKKRRRVCSRACVPPPAALAPASRLQPLLEPRGGLPARHRRPSSHAALCEAPCAAGQPGDARAARPTRPAGWGARSGGPAALGPDGGSGNARRPAAGSGGVAHSLAVKGAVDGALSIRLVQPAGVGDECPVLQPATQMAAAGQPALRPATAHGPGGWFADNAATGLQHTGSITASALADAAVPQLLSRGRPAARLPAHPPMACRPHHIACASLRCSPAPAPALLTICLQERRAQQARPRPRQARALRVVRRHGAPAG